MFCEGIYSCAERCGVNRETGRYQCTWQAGVEDPHVVGDVVHLTVVDDGGHVLVVTRGLVVTRDFERQPIALTRLFDVLTTVGDRVWRATAVRAAVSPLTVHGAHHVDGAVVAARQSDVIVETAERAELVCSESCERKGKV